MTEPCLTMIAVKLEMIIIIMKSLLSVNLWHIPELGALYRKEESKK